MKNGITGQDLKPALLVSEQAHYCVDRAVQVMGWGSEGVIKVPTNDDYQMDVTQLARLHDDAASRGRRVIAVVGSACSTATGTYDDLTAIGEFCQRHDLWFHVDGAHGAAVAFSDKFRELISGIELADSVVLDFHKLLMTPALTTALVFRDGQHNYQTFSQKAEYLFADDSQHDPWEDVALRSFECTKLMMSLKVFAIYQQYGLTAWDDNVTTVYDLARRFAALVDQREQLELLKDPASNIVCYRYVADRNDEHRNNQINAAIRGEILKAGEFYIVQTLLGGKHWLRSTFGSAMTQQADLKALLDKIESIGNQLTT